MMEYLGPDRDPLVDCLKGYACLLVVLGHVVLGLRSAGEQVPAFSPVLETFLWTFHVHLFLFLSGHVYRITGGWARQGSRRAFLTRKLLDLGVPYLAFSALYLLLNWLIPGTNHDSRPADLLWLWRQPIAQYWFLYALLILFVLWTVLSRFLTNPQITVVLFALNIVTTVCTLPTGILGYGLNWALVFGLGTCVPTLRISRWNLPKKLLLIISHILLVGLLILKGWSGRLLISDAESLLGIAASIALVSLLVRNCIVERFLLLICRYSFPIYLLHTIFTAGIRILLIRAGIHSYGVHVCAAMALGIAGPSLVGRIARLSPVSEFFFYPSKALTRLRDKAARAAY